MRKIVLMIMLLCSTGHVQAVPKSEEMMRLDRTITNLTLEAEHGPRLKSQIALVYDRKTKKPVYTKNIDKQVPIASITKLMTAMVVLDARLPLSEKIKITRDDIDTIKGTRSRLSIGTELTRRELLQLALMSSENRAASALARNYPGGTPAAIAAMNKKAVDLGMKKTHFVEATGLSKNNVSTAADLVNMVEAARQYQLIHQYTTMPTREVANHRGRTLRFNNTNPLVKKDSWRIGISKTGFINEAGRCLVMEADIGRRDVIMVLLDSHGRYTRIADAKRVRQWFEQASVHQF